jgi:hypothetical protein
MDMDFDKDVVILSGKHRILVAVGDSAKASIDPAATIEVVRQGGSVSQATVTSDQTQACASGSNSGSIQGELSATALGSTAKPYYVLISDLAALVRVISDSTYSTSSLKALVKKWTPRLEATTDPKGRSALTSAELIADVVMVINILEAQAGWFLWIAYH